ncbi:MAG: AI-2E family transporter, partial [Planctomycetaceae bacterium]|nr:AI-2E family transporter [Planctomycetaceae bacterium]
MRAFSGVLSQALLIVVMTIFLLAEGATFPRKLEAVAGATRSRLSDVQRITDDVNHYMAIKTGTSLLTGGFVALALWMLKIDFAVLWGLTAFLLNYVPNIGSIIAAVPAVLLALLQYGFGMALVVTGVYLAVNMAIGYFIEPRWMGRGLGLSTLVVFVSLVFWGWVLGPVGMVISVPLTMAVKIALEGGEETRWIAVLMGPGAATTEQA